ncbi:hypothetical protein AWB68_01252 [Caballeronia choica]|uniref:Uncharacterized protein n=1 Tax=Caballeronia choica TaxID=326476 RepID=A0A158G3X6_9BURK|nr:hypothetical protein AWB68_01252 [Caballeronia choica]
MGRSFRLQNGFGNHCNVRRHPPIGEGKDCVCFERLQQAPMTPGLSPP